MAPDSDKIDQPEGKGKGKAIATKDNTKEAEEHLDGDTIVSRLGRSAAELSKSVLKGAPGTDSLSNVASSGKSGTSSSGIQPGAWTESSFASSGSQSAGRSGSGSAVFRSTQTGAHVAAEEEAFSNFLDNTSVLTQTEPIGLLEEPLHNSTSSVPVSASYGQARYAAGSSVIEQEERDGVEVVRLLSQANEEPPSHDGDVLISKPELENLRRALFESGSDQMSASDWNNLLNFVPDFLRDEGFLESSQMQLGVVDTPQASQLWLEEWNRVLTSYTDEVWGDLGDLVHEARTEVQQIKDHQEEKPKADPKSLRRLRTILTHVRARL